MSTPTAVVFGGSGLVGSRCIELLEERFQFIVPLEDEVNLLDPDGTREYLDKHPHQVVVNLAAFTDVDKSEEEKGDQSGLVYRLNSQVPGMLAECCKQNDSQLIQISTDYVFSGRQEDRPYTEDDIPGAVGWYGQTKYEGERLAMEVGGKVTIARIEMPYRASYELKKDLLRTYLYLLKEVPTAKFVSDQKITPCFIDNIALGLGLLIEKQSTGIFHLGPTDWISPLDLAKKVAKLFGLDHPLEGVTFEEFYKEKPAKRPQYCWLDSRKFDNLSEHQVLESIEQSLQKVKQQL